MCGIAGIFDLRQATSAEDLRQTASRMGDSLRHRGPDAGDVWADAEAGIALAHRRLAIIDLSPAGAQPMHGADGNYVIVYNGEIYNFPELAAELRAEGRVIAGGSDTAVLLAAVAAWGLDKTLQKINGMFAFALWDRRARKLALVRDRLGIKPLYWAEANGKILFGSELRALTRHPDCPRDIDRQSLTHYFRAGNVPAPRSIFTGVHKLAPAHYLIIEPGRAPALTRYWDLQGLGLHGVTNSMSFGEASDALYDLLKDSVRGQMLADVPLGALLSGGIDSSTVAALMQAQSARPIRTFSIGFESRDFDEAPAAKKIAAHLGTAHTEAYVTEADARAVIPRLPHIYDEPFADSSQIPTYLVSKIAREHVTVALSGDGGDEGFLGYNRYRAMARMENWPMAARQHLAGLCAAIPAETMNRLGTMLPARMRIPQLGDKLVKFAALGGGDAAAAYRHLVSWWQEPETVVAGGEPVTLALARPAPADPVCAMQLWDMLGYLHDDVLTKVDRASMDVALEVRVPLLDHRIIEFALTLPRSYKLQGGVTKRILREIAYRHIPRALLERPKSGFGVPLAAWLRGPLKSWAADMLVPEMLVRAGLNPAPIREAWESHLAGRGNHHHRLWTALMFLSWRETYGI